MKVLMLLLLLMGLLGAFSDDGHCQDMLPLDPGPPDGVWILDSGESVSRPCPRHGEYGKTTRMPAGCVVQHPVIGYTLEVDAQTVAMFKRYQADIWTLKAEVDRLEAAISTQSHECSLSMQACEEDVELAHRQLEDVPEPPSRILWGSLGVVVGGVLFYAVCSAANCKLGD